MGRLLRIVGLICFRTIRCLPGFALAAIVLSFVLRCLMWAAYYIYELSCRTHALLAEDDVSVIWSQKDSQNGVGIQSLDAQLGNWPRRLLHVPSMTSYAWGPGNVYGSFQNPAYNIITYTWGRWQVRRQANPDGPAIEIHNVDWDLPSISPGHFTVAEFKRVIEACTVNAPSLPGWRVGTQPVEFLWLDVACIDQGSGTNRDKLNEIGRQAQIFDQASSTFVWLSHTPYQVLQEITDSLEEHIITAKYAGHNYPILKQRVSGMRKAYKRLFDDPWFSSLWTLQEAFLRPDAIVLAKEGRPVRHNSEKFRTLGRLIERTATAYRFCHKTRHYEGPQWADIREICGDVMRNIDTVGLAALNTKNPLATYVASRYRKTLKEVDRVYGIQQIFRLRLGATATDAVPSHVPESHELEDELGSELLHKHAILSQFHVFKKPAAVSRAWKIGSNSAVEELSLFGSGNWNWDVAEVSVAKLSTRRCGGLLWGHFVGRACRFQDLREAWASIDQRTTYATLIERRSTPSIFIDSTSELQHSAEYCYGHYDAIPRSDRQHRLARWMSKHFKPPQDLRVLLLGTLSGPGFTSMEERDPLDLQHHIGLVLLQKDGKDGFRYWHRLGICAWELGHLTFNGEDAPEKAFLEGKCDEWVHMEGYFG